MIRATVVFPVPGAPVKQALTDAGIGEEILGGYAAGSLQPYFSVVAKNADETDEAYEKRILDMAETIAKDRQNVEQIYGRLRGEMMFTLFNEKAKPATEKITIKEFVEKTRQ